MRHKSALGCSNRVEKSNVRTSPFIILYVSAAVYPVYANMFKSYEIIGSNNL